MKDWFSCFQRPAPHKNVPQPVLDNYAELPFSCEQGGGVAVPNRQKILRQLHESCVRQLTLLQQLFDLTSAVVLWYGPAPTQLSVYAFASSATLQKGPFQCGQGITGLFKERDDLVLAPVSNNTPAIPYYSNHDQVGSFFAQKLKVPATSACQQEGIGLLCVDRCSKEQWQADDIQKLSAFADQLSSNMAMARQLFAYDRERHAYRRAFDGLRKLNAALGLESTFTATDAAVRTMVPTDFLSINLVEGCHHRVSFVSGENADRLTGESFPVDQGLVGQVIKYHRTLPENADYQGNLPVFSSAHLFADYRSLMIIPLQLDEGSVVGAMIVAARQPEMFTRICREMLELVATQVAIKIELAKSHEKLGQMATVDGLTGIANRRAFDRGCTSMLDRAKRRSGQLSLVFCDIDYFKQINDRCGHPFGDEVLRQVAKLFSCVVRTNDLAARIGGEEFAILLEETGRQGALKVAERLRILVEGLRLRFGNDAVPVTISLGVAVFPEDAENAEQLISCVDKALYRAKETGRNRTVLWER